jgi:spermidine synthase
MCTTEQPGQSKKEQGRENGDSIHARPGRKVDESKATDRRRALARPFIVRVSGRFLAISFALANALSLLLGFTYQHMLLTRAASDPDFWTQTLSEQPPSATDSTFLTDHNMPRPILPLGKKLPLSKYSSNHYTTDNILRKSTNTLLSSEWAEVDVGTDGTVSPNSDYTTSATNGDHEDYAPSGQHLLIDIEDVDTEFLDSEQHLAQAMVDLITLSGLTLLSYHCHALLPTGVSCVGVLLESHISFHTWPKSGVIALDLFTCGPKPLLPLVPAIQTLFAIPQVVIDGRPASPQPNIIWTHKKRGFRPKDNKFNADDIDLTQRMLGQRNFQKTTVAHVETDLQSIDILDVFDIRKTGLDVYYKSLSNDGSYESLHPEFYRPNRIVYLDNVVQSRRFGDAAYHEALVHPSLFLHPNPKRVAILGGGEGATLREILKHDTIEEVVMVEIDSGIVAVCKAHLPEWNFCGDIVGSTASCFDDPRAKVYFEDAISWFVSRYVDQEEIAVGNLFDVIIMDVLDPDSVVEFSDFVYRNNDLVAAFSIALGENGILVAQTGKESAYSDPPQEFSDQGQLSYFVKSLVHYKFESIQEYSESHGGFEAPWTFLVAMKNAKSRGGWLTTNEAEINLEIRKRIRPSNSGLPALLFFDGSTMMEYQFPSRVTEEQFCRSKLEACETGHGLNPEIPNIPHTAFEVKPSTVTNAGRGVFAKKHIPAGSYISMESSVLSMFVPPSTYRLLNSSASSLESLELPFWKCLMEGYVDGYGWDFNYFGCTAAVVDPGMFKFGINSCDGTCNTGSAFSKTEADIEPADLKALCRERKPPKEPFLERHFPFFGTYKALQDIEAGQEVLDNYIIFYAFEDVDELTRLCSGSEVGIVSQFEDEH